MSQDRLTEKTFLTSLGIPTPPFAAVDTREQFDAAIADIGLPAVLKTRRFGYDGKGQAVLRTKPKTRKPRGPRSAGVRSSWKGSCPFDRELSILAVRGRSGETAFYPLTENEHREGMLYRSLAPAQ